MLILPYSALHPRASRVLFSWHCSTSIMQRDLLTSSTCAVASSTPSLLTTNPQLSLPLDVDRMGDQAQLVGKEDALLNSKHRQIQLQLQVCSCCHLYEALVTILSQHRVGHVLGKNASFSNDVGGFSLPNQARPKPARYIPRFSLRF